ncbi:MAG: sulfotransferase domain-containing protein, partial [Microcoleus sp. SIO2G3]|nr:sulfotransferase domain-containing protein [Microcoleus sp. SIO2G3]
CAANLKETRFFLDADYPLSSKYQFEDGLDKYKEFFNHYSPTNLFRLEATPDYLYSPGTAQRIKESLPHTKLVFILREPISRLISWYRFAQQIGQIPQDYTFETYVQEQWQAIEQGLQRPQYMRALEQGCYWVYLQPYFELFGTDNVYVTFQEDLAKDPKAVVQSICCFAGIISSFYENYEFKIINSTQAMKNSKLHSRYVNLRFRLRKYLHNRVVIRKILRQLRLLVEPAYYRLNTQATETFEISDSTKTFLEDYYKQDVNTLQNLLGKSVPWQTKTASYSELKKNN